MALKLRMMPDGRYVALTWGAVLIAGRLGGVEHEDEQWWRIPLSFDPIAAVSLELVGEDVWVCVMEHAAEQAHVARISRDGAEITTWSLASLCLPAPTASALYTQPSSDTICRLDLTSGQTELFDISAHNQSSSPAVIEAVYRGSPTPPAPTRLPGYLAAQENLALFVPWHAETVVQLFTSTVHPRGLPDGPAMMRRALLEALLRDNAALATFNVQAQLNYFEFVAKPSSSPMSHSLPRLPQTMPFVAMSHALNPVSRYDLNTTGWCWGSANREGGSHWPSSPDAVTHEHVKQTLDLMRRADWLPFELTELITNLYSHQLGIPNDATPACLFGAPERLMLRAM